VDSNDRFSWADKRRSGGEFWRLKSRRDSVQNSLSILTRRKPQTVIDQTHNLPTSDRLNDRISSSANPFGPYSLTLLHQPPQPLIDLIFVHGLRGGSVKTWRKYDYSQSFWPRDWLPQEPDLQHVRIHTFGYNSDWMERKESILNIHDFSKDLLGDMMTDPHSRARRELPIVLVGHSMGGLGKNTLL
jgi:hypothetical protein